MDPISLSALVALITKSAAGEAGKSAWEGLVGLARRAFGHGPQAEAALRGTEEGDRDAALDLAGRLVQSAAADPELDGLLRSWIARAREAPGTGNVTNNFGGNARVHGDVVQARDIGTVNLGRDRRSPDPEPDPAAGRRES